MSHYYLKTKYNEEGAYGSIEEHTLYAHHNLSCDYVSFYNEKGECILSVPDTLDNNILDAMNKVIFPFTGRDLILEEGIEHMSIEEQKKCGFIR